MNHFQQQQQHVAQQSRREKLRIPGSLHHPSSPQSDHSAGSASAVLESRQPGGASEQQENYTRGYSDVLPYQNVISATDAYSNFSTGSELLAYAAAKANGNTFMATGSDMLPPGFNNQISKNWSGNAGQYNGGGNPLSVAAGGGTSNSQAVAATLLSSLQGVQQQQQQQGGPMSGYNAEAMQLFLTGYPGYSDPSTPGSMVLISPSSGSSVQSSHVGGNGGGGGGQQHFIGIPLTPSQGDAGNGGGFGARSSGTYNNWRNGGDEFLFLPSSEATLTQQRKALSGEAGGLSQIADISEYALRQQQQQQQQQPSLSSMLGQQQQSLLQAGHQIDNSTHQGAAAAVAGSGYQSLSLSLSNQNAQLQALETSGLSSPVSQDGIKRGGGKMSGDLSHFRSSPRDTYGGGKHMYFEGGGAAAAAVSNSFNFVSGSRYLRAAQQLLDEVCSVGRGGKQGGSKSRGSQGVVVVGSPTAVTSSVHKEGAVTENSVKSEITMGSSAVATSPGTGGPAATVSTVAPSTTAESKANVAVLTPEERQEYEGKKTKLLAMLQEVDRRYRQYYDQMQVVITSFDAVAGAGAATPYTALALQAMSRYFRCLRDAITTQIQTTCKALGEEDVTKSITSRPLTSRLRFIDQQIRQQRAYQQYGMLQQHAWRPQRGLPERSVSILRAWLFEHFLHPYPKDADKMMLARQTGLTRGQVSNWFINARVRLWKPMVEEMYQEEIKEQELGVASARLAVDPEDKHHHHQQQHQQQHDGIGEGMMSESRSDHSLAVVDKMQLDHHPDHHHHHHQSSYSSDYGLMMRKADSQLQMFGESQQQEAAAAQVKKTRLGIHDSIGGGLLGADSVAVAAAVAAAGMDVDLKSDSGMCVAPTPSSLERHYVHDQYVHPDNFAATVAQAARYGGGGFGSSPAAYHHHHQGGGSGGVSLTLGLRNCDNLIQQSFLAAAAAQHHHHQQQQQQNFLAPRTHHQQQMAGGDHTTGGHELCNVYENAAGGGGAGMNEQDGIDYQGRKQQQQQQQQIESHLLHDFVA